MAASRLGELKKIKVTDIAFVKHLGSGGFGGVRLGKHKVWGDVAIKEFHDVTLTDEVRREANKMHRVMDSTYMVRIMGLLDQASLGIVMEYFKYGDLKNFQQKYMDCVCGSRKVKMLLDIAHGMNYLHTSDPPIIHLDLKLENVFVGNGLDAKIGDMGLAMSASTAQKRFKTSDKPGTLTHIPPEAWRGTVKIPDASWDIFTFAITMYEYLSGKDPWQHFAGFELIAFWVKNNLRPDLTIIPKDTPVEIVDIMKRCWNDNPSDRPTFQVIQEEISAIYHNRHPQGTHTADMAIMQRIYEVDSSSEKTSSDSAREDGAFTWGDFDRMKISSRETLTSKDSGQGASADSHTSSTQGQHVNAGAQSVQQWRVIQTFGQEGTGEGEFKMARSIAVYNNNDIVVVDFELERVYVFSKSGGYKHTIVSPQGKPEVWFPNDACITSNGEIAIVDSSKNPNVAKYVKLYDVNGTYQRRFCILRQNEPQDTKVIPLPASITVSLVDDTLLVGDTHRKVVTIHAASDGTWKQQVQLCIKPMHLATNSCHMILACDWKVRKIVCVDYAGTVVFTLDSFTVDGEPGMPEGLTCGDDDTLYVAVKEINEKDGSAYVDTGHIHQYSSRGTFVRCIMKGLYYPRGITWHNGCLYVANDLSVVILGK